MNARNNEGLLRQAAKRVGTVVGKIGALVRGNVEQPEETQAAPSHRKPRLPRKQKKSPKKKGFASTGVETR
jgi:hypothetical protein